MGSGSSRKKIDRKIQVPSAPKSRTRTPSPPVAIRHESYFRRPFSSQPSPWLKHIGMSKQQSTSNLANYATIWEQNGKLSSTFQQLIRSESTKIEHDQKESNKQELITKHSSTYGSAQVNSILKSKIETIHNLSTSERVDTLMLNLKQTHVEFDESLKRRIGQITSETESILAQVVEETQQSQQQLLINAKKEQIIQDEQYRILLQEFISELDEKRVKQLALIQEQLQEQRLEIFNESQLKLRAVSEQANSVKNQIMSEEERKASEKIDLIVTEINTITTESAIQQLGAEMKTKINLTIHEKVGSKLSGQQFLSDSDDDRINSASNQPNRTTFTYIDKKISERPISSTTSDHQNKSTKQNPKTKS